MSTDKNAGSRLRCFWIGVVLLIPATAVGVPGQAVGDERTQSDGVLEVVFLDVGQGDAILVRTPEGDALLVDGGPDPGVVPLLQGLGVHELTLVVASHPHLDHIGGLTAVLETLPIEYYMDPGVPHTTRAYADLLARVEASEARYLEAASRTLWLGDLEVRVLPPFQGSEDLNNRSVALLLRWGDFRVLLTGDSERDQLDWLARLDLPTVTVLKAPHHGSRTGVTRSFLTQVSPEVVVVSVGLGNSYGHPHAEALEMFGEVGARVLRTDRDGQVVIAGSRSGEWNAALRSQDAAADEAQRGALGPALVPLPLAILVTPDAPGNDHKNPNGEFVDLTNTGGELIDLSGFTICDQAMHCFRLPAGATVPTGAMVRIHSGQGEASKSAWYLGSSRAIWNNGGDTVLIRDREGRVVLSHAY